jgi:hypothetical protein
MAARCGCGPCCVCAVVADCAARAVVADCAARAAVADCAARAAAVDCAACAVVADCAARGDLRTAVVGQCCGRSTCGAGEHCARQSEGRKADRVIRGDRIVDVSADTGHSCMAALHGCMAAWLHGCMAAWLHGCMAAWAAWLHGVPARAFEPCNRSGCAPAPAHHLARLDHRSAQRSFTACSAPGAAPGRTSRSHELAVVARGLLRRRPSGTRAARTGADP